MKFKQYETEENIWVSEELGTTNRIYFIFEMEDGNFTVSSRFAGLVTQQKFANFAMAKDFIETFEKTNFPT